MLKNIAKALLPQVIQDRLRIILRRKRSNPRLITHRYLGHQLSLYMIDTTSYEWYNRDWLEGERTEFAEIASRVRPNGLIFNLGAHQGLVAILMRKIVVPDGRVIAVEMDQTNAATAQKNIIENSIEHITVLNLAISDCIGTIYSRGLSNDQILSVDIHSKFFGRQCESVTIDNLVQQYGVPDAIYIDIEGAEVLALRAASSALGVVPVWFLELHGPLCDDFGGSNRTLLEPFLADHLVSVALSEDAPFEPVVSVTDIPVERCFAIATLKRASDARHVLVSDSQ